jgi:hypothetical protein
MLCCMCIQVAMKKKGARLIKESTKEGKARVKAEMDLQVAIATAIITNMLLQLLPLLVLVINEQ